MDIFPDGIQLFDIRDSELLAREGDHLLHQHLGRGGAGSETDHLGSLEPFQADVGGGLDQIGIDVPRAGHFAEPE